MGGGFRDGGFRDGEFRDGGFKDGDSASPHIPAMRLYVTLVYVMLLLYLKGKFILSWC